MTRVLFYGNSQAAVLSNVYNRFAATASDAGSDWASSSPADLEETEEKVSSAELLVAQVGSSETLEAIAALNTAAQKVLFPAVSAAFLWPFGGQPHPQNRQTKYRKEGPYDGQLGDSYLNRKFNRGADVEATVAKYECLETAHLPDLDRIFTLTMEQQRWRDEATGFSFASRIADDFRTERLFIGPDRPGPALARRLVIAVFERFIPDRATLATVERGLVRSPFPDYALPIHPAVARHFGLSFLGDTPRYRYGHEGSFTFAEYCRRYMQYTWSPELDDALAGLRSAKPERTIKRLEAALDKTPTSAFGRAALAGLLFSAGRETEALSTARAAAALDTDHARTHLRLAVVFQKAGLQEETERELRAAVACDPTDLNGLSALSRFLLQHERLEEAVEIVRRMTAVEPEREPIRIQLVTILLRLNRLEEAVAELRGALTVAPDNAALHRSLSNLLANRRDLVGAEAAARRATELDPETIAHQTHLATMLMRLGRLDEAAAVLRSALERAPDNAMALSTLSLILVRQRRPDEALEAARQAAALAPRNPAFKTRLEKLAAPLGDAPGTKAAPSRKGRQRPKPPSPETPAPPAHEPSHGGATVATEPDASYAPAAPAAAVLTAPSALTTIAGAGAAAAASDRDEAAGREIATSTLDRTADPRQPEVEYPPAVQLPVREPSVPEPPVLVPASSATEPAARQGWTVRRLFGRRSE